VKDGAKGPGSAGYQGPGYAWVILIVGTLCLFGAVGMGRFAYGMVLPAMQEGLGMNNTEAGALATANLIGYLAMSAIGGALATRFGPRVVITVGMLVTGLGMLLTGLAAVPLTAAIWRTFTGIGGGAVNVPTMGLIPAWFDRRRRGLAIGIVLAGSSAGLIIAGPLVPRILNAFGDNGWRVSWYIFGGVTLLLAVAGLILLRNRPDEKALILRGGEPGSTVETAAASEEGAQASEPESARPRFKVTLDWHKVYRSPSVWHLGVVYLAYGFSYIIYMTFFAKRLIADIEYSKEAAGSLFMLVGWLSLFCGVIWGAFSDRFGRKPALIAVYVLQATAFALFAGSTHTAALVVSAVLFGLTAWSIPTIMAATCGDALGPRLAPAALGLITLFFGLGQAIGPTVAGALADSTGNFSLAFWLAAGVALLGAIGAGTLRPAATGADCVEEPLP